jgi:hypothetical protein
MWNQEEKPKELRRRLLAAMKAHGVSWDDLKDENGEWMLRMDSGVPENRDDDPDPLILAKRHNRVLKADEAEIEAMVETIRTENIGLLILDPLVEFHEGNENDNMEMRIVMTALRTIAARSNCAIVVFAHTAKPPVAPSKSFAGHIGAIRGAFSQVGAARVVATVFPAAKDDEKTWTLPGGYKGYTRIDVCKINNGPKQTIWLRHDFEPVGSERIPTLKHVKIEPKVKEGETTILEAFARVMAETDQLNNVPLKTLIDQVPELTTEDKAELGGHAQTRKRRLNRAFGGDDANEALTDYGKLIRITRKAPVGTLLTLKPLKRKEAECEDSAPEDLLG